MKTSLTILLFLTFFGNPFLVHSQKIHNITVSFCGDIISLNLDSSLEVKFDASLSKETIQAFYTQLNSGNYKSLVSALLDYKNQHKLNDWLYYQLIRRTAQQISPKAENYYRYTLYKWFLLTKSGYNASLAIGHDRLLFYVRSDDNIYDIPLYLRDGKQYVCLNYHDYGYIDFAKEKMFETYIEVPEAQKAFSYKVTNLPDFKSNVYAEKNISFQYKQKIRHYKLALNTQVQAMFTNYPGVDFESYFNIPMSAKTYSSLIPELQKDMQGLNQKNGIEYLMQFTRNAFGYANDQSAFGKEKDYHPNKRFFILPAIAMTGPDFFYLVKEIYDLPMIVMVYPEHVTIAVKLDKPVGDAIVYKGEKYSVCEPTPQGMELKVGEILPALKKTAYDVVYAYHPHK